MGDLAAAGVNSFKFFLAYKGALAVTDAQLLNGLARCKELGALPLVRFQGAGVQRVAVPHARVHCGHQHTCHRELRTPSTFHWKVMCADESSLLGCG